MVNQIFSRVFPLPPPGVERSMFLLNLTIPSMKPFFNERKAESTPEKIFARIQEQSSQMSEGDIRSCARSISFVDTCLWEVAETVTTIAAYYLMSNMSLADSLKKIASHSDKVSAVVLPILNRINALPIPPILLSTRVIIITPIMLKLIYMIFVYFSLQNEGKVKAIEWAKNGMNFLNQGIQFLFNLRYAVLCLGLSETLYRTIAFTVAYVSLRYFLQSPIDFFLDDNILKKVKLILKDDDNFNSVKEGLNQLLIITLISKPLQTFIKPHYHPTWGFQVGLTAAYQIAYPLLPKWPSLSRPSK